ncbi:MAG: pantetheine-phosphate adenylyltransferase [Thermoplasmata archaeon]|nr:pantetheine-phosphate adenylyltransferase [Thermoplasmata archaeon]
MRVVVGGTFNVLHKGHKALLSKAAGLATHLCVGITTDEMAGKGRDVPVRPYEERKEEVCSFLDSLDMGGRYVIRPIGDAFGFALEEELEAIVSGPTVVKNVEAINMERRRIGIPVLEVYVVDMELADDTRPISSTRVVRGEMDVEGRRD